MSFICLVPVPLQWMYVVIETKEINLSNPDLFSKLNGSGHSNKSEIVKDYNCKLL